MRLDITGRHVTIGPALQTAVERWLVRLERRLGDGIVSLQVVVTKEKAAHRVEATLHARGDHFLHGEARANAAKAAIDAALDKIEHQATKLKGKWVGRHRDGAGKRGRPEPRDGVPAAAAQRSDGVERVRVVRARRYEVKPMTIEDAALQVAGDRSSFLVFRNSATDTINVLFRRPDGNLGLIEPEG